MPVWYYVWIPLDMGNGAGEVLNSIKIKKNV